MLATQDYALHLLCSMSVCRPAGAGAGTVSHSTRTMQYTPSIPNYNTFIFFNFKFNYLSYSKKIM